ncbi:ANR26 protein, partial [Amia calva]|nr:ANR26 protein [Amia calva]
MKKIFSFTKKRKKGFSPNSSDTGSVLSVGYDLKEKDLGKLHKAASTGDLSKLKQLVKKHDFNQLDKENRTPLHLACAFGHADIVTFLAEKNAKLNLCDNQNRSPLMKAVQCQHERCVVSLLEHKADPNLVDINGNTALHLTALIPSISLAVQLLEHEASINATNKEGCTPLILAVTENHLDMVSFLLKEGADIDASDTSTRTPLMIAASNGHISMIRLLLRYDADVSIKDDKGWTADDHAVMNGHHACSHLIIERGTKSRPPQSPSHSKGKGAGLLSSPITPDAGLTVGGPAVDREVEEDISEAGCLSRASNKDGAEDSWPSSDDEELDFSPKKPQKINLRELLSVSQKSWKNALLLFFEAVNQPGSNACTCPVVKADPSKSSEGESEPESEDGAMDGAVSPPMALPLTSTALHPASPSPASFSTLPLMTSTPLQESQKEEDEEQEQEDDEEEEEEEDDDEEEDEEDEDGDEEDEDDEEEEDEGGNLLSGDGDDSWLSEDGDGQDEHKDDVNALQDKVNDVPVSLIVGHYEGECTLSKDSENEPKAMHDHSESINNEIPYEIDVREEEQDAGRNLDFETQDAQPRIPSRSADVPKAQENINEEDSAGSIEDDKEKVDSHPQLRMGVNNSEKAMPGKTLDISENEAGSWGSNPDVEIGNENAKKEEEEEEEDEDVEAPPTPGSGQEGSSTAGVLALQEKDTSSKDVKRDLLSELGLEQAEEDDSPWDSEFTTSSFILKQSGSDSPSPLKTQAAVHSISEENNEDLFYTPSFLRGSRSYRMAKLEDSRSVGGRDLMEELGLGDVDDLEDASDSDSVSTASRNLAALKLTSPECDEKRDDVAKPILSATQGKVSVLESPEPEQVPAREKGPSAHPPLPCPRSLPSLTTPQPQPRSRTMLPVQAETEDVSDWDSDNDTSISSPEKSWSNLPISPEKTATLEKLGCIDDVGLICPICPFFLFLCLPKDKDLSDTAELEISNPVAKNIHVIQKEKCHQEEENRMLAQEGGPEAHWEARYEKIWVEKEKREVKSHYKNVAAELKEKFGEIALKENMDDSCTTLARLLHERDGTGTLLDVSEEDSNDDEEFAHSMAMAQSGVLQPIAEQRESSLDNSVTEPADVQEDGSKPHTQSTDVTKATNNADADLACDQDGDDVDNERMPKLYKQKLNAGAHQAAFVNGDPLSVFDDSTLSEMSDDGGSFIVFFLTHQNNREVEMADDFDDLTQSSDTATEEMESPTSGYRNASLLIKQLDSGSIDSVTLVKIQNMFHEYERTIQKEKGRYSLLYDKVTQLENERRDMRKTLEDTRDGKSSLEHRQVALETDLNNLKFVLKQEQEKHNNAAMLYEKSREQLRKKEEQYRKELEEKQQLELTMRNLEMEMRSLINNMKQLEEDRNEAQRLLSQERNARVLQEGILNNHLRKQKEIEEDNKRTVTKSTEVISQLSEASDVKKDLLHQNRSLQDEVAVLKLELDRVRVRGQQEEARYTEQNEALKEKTEDLKRDLKMNEEALAQTVFQYNGQVSALRAECSRLTSKLEHEKQSKDQLETEVESVRLRLTSALQEVEHSQAAKADAERILQRERDEWLRLQEKHNVESSSQRESISSLSQQLGKAEAKANSLENECHRATLSLTEKTLLLETMQRERDQTQARLKDLEVLLQAEKEKQSKSSVRQETMQERLAQAQSENMLLRQQVEEAQNKGLMKEKAVTDVQDRFSDILAKLRADSDERVQMVEDRSRELVAKNRELQEQIFKQESEKSEREAAVRQLQQELADALKKLSMCEASLEVNTRYRNDLEEEKVRMQKDMDRMKGKLQETEDLYIQTERRIHDLKIALDDKEREVISLEIENARLEAASKQQTNRIEVLQKEAQESEAVQNRLGDLVTNLQGTKINLEEQLNREVQKQGMLSHNAQDSHLLWEAELKSRSKLGLRLAELEREKGDLINQVEIEKKKSKKIAELKRTSETRLEQEMKRNSDLQKEMNRLRTYAKAAKKRLKDQETLKLCINTKNSDVLYENDSHKTVSYLGATQVDDLSQQLDRETLKSTRLETENSDLREQLSSLKTLSKRQENLERSKRQLEDEVARLRRHLDTNMMDQSQMEQYRCLTEERAQQEIRQKLEEVNLFLQSQAASQEALEQIKATNEATLRNKLEQRIRDLECELSRVRSTQQDSLSQRDSTQAELERYKDLYAEEIKLRKSIAAKLERSNERLDEANTKLLSERQRSKSLIANSFVNGSLAAGPSLDMSALQGGVGTFGGSLGPLNRNLGLGGNFLSPVGHGLSQNNRVEAYLAKMQSELEKNISKELDNANAELDRGSARMSPVGSAAGLDQDPVSRATQQYLEVLKKNYKI